MVVEYDAQTVLHGQTHVEVQKYMMVIVLHVLSNYFQQMKEAKLYMYILKRFVFVI